MEYSSSSPNALLRLALTGVGSFLTIVGAILAWLQLSLKSLGSTLQPQASTVRLRRGRMG